jgi:hypothetical protein
VTEHMMREETRQAAAIGNLRTIDAAQTAFHSAHGRYATSFDDLTSATPPYLDGDWRAPRSQYLFTLSGDGQNYVVRAEPAGNLTGSKTALYFYTDASSVVSSRRGAPADPNDHGDEVF